MYLLQQLFDFGINPNPAQVRPIAKGKSVMLWKIINDSGVTYYGLSDAAQTEWLALKVESVP